MRKGCFVNSLIANAHTVERQTDADTEAELLYYLIDSVEYIRPSVIFKIAIETDGPKQFLQCLKLCRMASSFPERAEAFAGDAVDTFSPGQEARADRIYRTILSAVRDAVVPDPDWLSARQSILALWGYTK